MTTVKHERPATIYDVAAQAGVSHQTVSRYLKGFEGIRPQTRDRVEQALRELDYRPNLSARALATNRSHRIAALTSDLLSAGPAQTVQGLTNAARAAGYLVDIVSIDAEKLDSIDTAVSLLRQQALAGIVVIAVSDPIREAISGVDFGVPLYVDSGPADLDESEGHSFNALGMEMVVDHLVSLGHQSIMHVAGPAEWIAARNRARAFEDRVRHHGLSTQPHRFGDWTARSGFDAVMQESLPYGVTAIACANDQMALGAIHGLAQLGVSVPDDVSVTGFDDVAEAQFFLPALTTVRIDFGSQGTFLFDSVLAQIDGTTPPDSRRFMHPTLVTRASAITPGPISQ